MVLTFISKSCVLCYHISVLIHMRITFINIEKSSRGREAAVMGDGGDSVGVCLWSLALLVSI